MGRNIDLDEMINNDEMKCCKCGHNNTRALEEFDIDCYEFENGICSYEFECYNCTFENSINIQIKIKNDDEKSEREEINSQEVKPTTKPRVKRKRKEPVIYRDFKQEDNPSTPDNTLSEDSEDSKCHK